MGSLNCVSSWDCECDILIGGFGRTEASAAIEAHDTDPTVDIPLIEKPTELTSDLSQNGPYLTKAMITGRVGVRADLAEPRLSLREQEDE